jgi:hypothetical protein
MANPAAYNPRSWTALQTGCNERSLHNSVCDTLYRAQICKMHDPIRKIFYFFVKKNLTTEDAEVKKFRMKNSMLLNETPLFTATYLSTSFNMYSSIYVRRDS